MTMDIVAFFADLFYFFDINNSCLEAIDENIGKGDI